MAGIVKRNDSLFQLSKSVLFLCLFNFLLYKINNLYMAFMNKIGKTI